MVSETIEIRIILRHYFKKGFSAAKAAREICDVEGEDSMPERTAQRWYQRFKAGDMSLEDKPRSGRPSTVDQEELRAAIEANPVHATCPVNLARPVKRSDDICMHLDSRINVHVSFYMN